ncbi:MAG: bidirectional hydrogenase complex protein HoxU [Acidobacteriota bacterium]
MSETVTFILDGEVIEAKAGQTILQAAEAAGKYIPRLCAHRELSPHGSCRVCTVLVNGRPQASCTQPVAEGIVVESQSAELVELRKQIVELLFVEGNHFCMFCEKSGNCELQALAYRLGITAPRFPYQFPVRDVDAGHPDAWLDRNRCILCGRCVRASKELDGKNVFQFAGRGIHKKLAVNSRAGLGGTDLAAQDRALEVCPVGALLPKRQGYKTPVGRRKYDCQPIGSEIEGAAVSSSRGGAQDA